MRMFKINQITKILLSKKEKKKSKRGFDLTTLRLLVGRATTAALFQKEIGGKKIVIL